MKRAIVASLVSAVFLGASSGQAEWRMRVHQGETTTHFVCSSVDSVTYFDFNAMVEVLAGTFTMGDGVASCGEDERDVTLTRDFNLGKHEVTNQEYMEAVQWAYDNGYVTATTSTVQDNLDGSTEALLNLDSQYCEIQFDDGTESFYLRESPSSNAQNAYPGGYDPSDHPVKGACFRARRLLGHHWTSNVSGRRARLLRGLIRLHIA